MILTASQKAEKVFLSSRGVFLVRVAIMMFLRIIKVREIGKKKKRVTRAQDVSKFQGRNRNYNKIFLNVC